MPVMKHTPKILLIIIALYATGFFSHALYLKKSVYGDGIFYYSWLRSFVVDSDIDFSNEYSHYEVAQPPTSLGYAGNKYSIGPALLWLPSYLWTHSIIKGDGYSLPYQLAAGYTSMSLALVGLILLYRFLLKSFSKQASLLAVAGIAGATNLLFYGSLDPVNSHALSFFAATAFLTLLAQRNRNWFLVGAGLGFLALFRLQDVVYALILVTYFRGTSCGSGTKTLTRILLGFLSVFVWQLLAWQTLYGSFFINPYLSGGEGFNFFRPQIFGVLFSPTNGLFLWTPITMVGLFGLFWKKSWGYIAVFVIQLLLVASWNTWWQGASYSGRMFVSTLPLLAIGLAQIYAKILKLRFGRQIILYSLTLPLSVLNALFVVRFLLNN